MKNHHRSPDHSPVSSRNAARPNGGRVNQDTDLGNGDKPAAIILAHARDVALDGVTVIWPDDAEPPARNAVYGEALDGADLRGLRGSASVPGMPPVRIERSRAVQGGAE